MVSVEVVNPTKILQPTCMHNYISCSHISDQFIYEVNVFIKGE